MRPVSFIVLGLAGFIVWLSVVGGLAYVAVHFIAKFW